MSRRIGARSGSQQRPFRCSDSVEGAPVSARAGASGPEVVHLAGIDDAGRRSVETPALGISSCVQEAYR